MVSIVIPAYNEEKIISRCLTSLTKQITKRSFEVIVVDNNSTDKTVAVVKQFVDKLNIKIIHEKQKGRGAARHTGFQQAKGNIILSTDADCQVFPNWINTMTAYLIDNNIIAVTGTCIVTDGSWFTNYLFNHGYQTFTQLYYWIFHKHWCLVGFNFAVKKEAYVKTIGFNRSLNCREDADLSEKIAKLGKIKLVGIPVIYSGRRYKKGFFVGTLSYTINLIKSVILGKEALLLQDIR